MVKRASEGLAVRYGEGAAKLEGPNLAKFMTTLDEYIGFFDKVDKRMRDEHVTELLPKLDLAKRADFEGEKKSPPAKLTKLERQLKALAKDRDLKDVKLEFEDEHSLWEASYTDSNGAVRKINWVLVATPEYRQMMAKYKQIEAYMQPPFIVEGAKPAAAAPENGETEGEQPEIGVGTLEQKLEKKAAKAGAGAAGLKPPRKKEVEVVEKQGVRELFDYVLNEGKKDFMVQRYKGLGEMTAEQLWETTMDPEKRTLLSVKAEDIEACETIFTTLMGEDVEARRKFIEENALDVKNLDI